MPLEGPSSSCLTPVPLTLVISLTLEKEGCWTCSTDASVKGLCATNNSTLMAQNSGHSLIQWAPGLVKWFFGLGWTLICLEVGWPLGGSKHRE
jgi:hypothetical protein